MPVAPDHLPDSPVAVSLGHRLKLTGVNKAIFVGLQDHGNPLAVDIEPFVLGVGHEVAVPNLLLGDLFGMLPQPGNPPPAINEPVTWKIPPKFLCHMFPPLSLNF
jgi:hypothetical protein